MIATPQQTKTLRTRYGLDPDLWWRLGEERGHTLVCQDLALISYTRIVLQDESANFRIYMRDSQSCWMGIIDDRPVIPHAYLGDVQNRRSYNRGVTWPIDYELQYADATFNQLRQQGADATGRIIAHASTRILPALQVNYPADPPGFHFYSWLKDPQLAGELLGLRKESNAQMMQSLKLVFGGLAARLLITGKGRT
jgi:hypothetical protein